MEKRDLESMVLTRQELEIMKVVWERGSATVGEVRAVLARSRPTAYTTVLTLMGILEDKGALAHSQSGRAYVYRPLLTREQATRNQVRDLLVRYFDGAPHRLIASLLDGAPLDPESLRTIREMLDGRTSADAGTAKISSAQLVGA